MNAVRGPRLIGLHGRKRSGKDTVAGFIRDWAGDNGLDTEVRYFAGYMKQSICQLLKIPPEHIEAFKLDGRIDVQYPHPDKGGQRVQIVMDGREFHQRYGTESHREIFDFDFWVKLLLPDFTPEEVGERGAPHMAWWDEFNRAPVCVIADLRFPNEINRVLELGGDVWLIKRDKVESDGHASEQLYPDLCTHEIDNNGALKETEAQVRRILSPSLS